MYLINALLVLLVVRQVRERQLGLRALAVPVLAVGAAAVMFLHSVPGGGSDIALDLLCLPAGAALGAVGGLAAHLRAERRWRGAWPARRPAPDGLRSLAPAEHAAILPPRPTARGHPRHPGPRGTCPGRRRRLS